VLTRVFCRFSLFVALSLWAVALVHGAEPTLGEITDAIRNAGLDPAECYRVRDLGYAKEDIRIYFNEGYLIFGKPVLGHRPWVIFSSDVEGGDAEIILIPPTRSERQSLAKFSQTPNLNEHLRSVLLVSTDGTADELLETIQKEERGRKAPEAAPLLMEKWGPVVANIAQPMQMRLVQDLLGPHTTVNGLMFLAVSGKVLGNFDVVLDARAGRRIAVRQRTERNGKSVYDVWTSFLSRSARTNSAKRVPADFSLPHFDIEASIDDTVRLKATTRVKVKIGPNAMRAFPFEIANAMHVTSVKIDGSPG
jgi:hypothetical protein